MFKREYKTVVCTAGQLENLIAYFRRNDGVSTLMDKEFDVTAISSGLNFRLKFRVIFPISWVKKLPLDQAIQIIMDGKDES